MRATSLTGPHASRRGVSTRSPDSSKPFDRRSLRNFPPTAHAGGSLSTEDLPANGRHGFENALELDTRFAVMLLCSHRFFWSLVAEFSNLSLAQAFSPPRQSRTRPIRWSHFGASLQCRLCHLHGTSHASGRIASDCGGGICLIRVVDARFLHTNSHVIDDDPARPSTPGLGTCKDERSSDSGGRRCGRPCAAYDN